jgi:NAD(P)H-hydrate epimerase
MYVVTAEEMRAIDRHTIDAIGIPAAVLMENAGREAARVIGEWAGLRFSAIRVLKVLILVGKGNNGGDGLVAARHLEEAGHDVTVLFAISPAQLSGDAALQRDIAERFGLRGEVYGEKPVDWGRYDVVVDALLGTGTKGAPREPYAALIREANGSGAPIVAFDIPSGLDADTGAVHEPCIRAALTVTLAFRKRGLMQYPGAELAGEVICVPIGIPERLAETFGVQTFLLDEKMLQDKLRVDLALPRRNDTHKGSYGHALIAAGCMRMSGAALLAARAALRGGCGLATLAVPERLRDALIGHAPELMLAAIPDGGSGDWAALAQGLAADGGEGGEDAAEAKAQQPIGAAQAGTANMLPNEASGVLNGGGAIDAIHAAADSVSSACEALLAVADGKQAVLLGPGMGRFAHDTRWLRHVWPRIAAPLVVDADALNMLADAGGPAAFPARSAPTILTPHPGEMGRLVGASTREVQRDRIGLARRYATEHGVTLVLKGAGTVVATPAGAVYINVNGNPGMATGGAGDVLAGLIAGLLAQGLDAEQATALGVYLHGAAGDRAAARRNSAASLIAGDLLDAL